MSKDKLGLFNGEDKPTPEIGWEFYQRGLEYNNSINLDDTVEVNENFYIGKQWEGVQSNGLPTPVYNFIKRVVGFIVATITSDNIKVNASALAATAGTEQLFEPVRIVNEEFDAITERNNITYLIREYARNAAVDGDGCTYTYWDESVDSGQEVKGAIKTEIIENTRVFFGNPNDRAVQSQPWIIISQRELVRNARRRAKENGIEDWERIVDDISAQHHSGKEMSWDDKCDVLTLLWRDDDSGEIWSYEFTQTCEVKKPVSLGIRLYPITWLNWDYVQDSYHGQAMVTGLEPSQIFVNKMWALTQVSSMRMAYPKYIYDKSRIAQWDNRVGAAIGINGGDINGVATILDPASISPQVFQLIQLAVEQSEQSLGATAVALGDTRPDNTSAIIALQRAAQTPSEITKQNLYRSIEDLYRIYLEFMAEYYGERDVDTQPPPDLVETFQFVGMPAPEQVQTKFDFGILKNHPMTIKLEPGSGAYFNEITAATTLDNLLRMGQIDIVDYLERIPDSAIPQRFALLERKKQAMQQMQMQQMIQQPQPEGQGAEPEENEGAIEVQGGRGYNHLAHVINKTGTTEGQV
jgi:hypothetical protein